MGERTPQGRALLNLLQTCDSAFPTGAFSHSFALEAFADAGELANAGDLRSVVGACLDVAATSDCVALRAALTAGSAEELVRIDRLLAATKLGRELRRASAATGRRFLASVAALGDAEVEPDGLFDEFRALANEGQTPANAAVAQGVAAPRLGLGSGEALLGYLYATASALVAAGQKLIPLGGSTAQHTLRALGEEILGAVEKSRHTEVQDMHAFAPLLELRSMLHERQRTRLYIS